MAMGALSGSNMLMLSQCLLLAVLASLMADTLWYCLGRRSGQSVLKTLCRISLEPDSCISLAKDGFQRMGSAVLLIAKFIPGVSTVTPPMAGVSHMPLGKFLLLDAVGSALWAGVSLALGFALRDQLQRLIDSMSRMGALLGISLCALLAIYVGVKAIERRKFIRYLRSNRISPQELRTRMKSGAALSVLDLRRDEDVGEDGAHIPGAIRFSLHELDKRQGEIPRDREVVLYCSCPNEATSAYLAKQLNKRGIPNVHLLHGGFERWTSLGFEVESNSKVLPERTSETEARSAMQRTGAVSE
jgi:membrane protein DedA with SNARE-associated domain/rhodanese-related sulfurtransferase